MNQHTQNIHPDLKSLNIYRGNSGRIKHNQCILWIQNNKISEHQMTIKYHTRAVG